MAFQHVVTTGPIIIDQAAEQLRAQFAANLKVGEHVPPAVKAPEVFGVKSATYAKILRRFGAEGLITNVGHGIGWVYGKPSQDAIDLMVVKHRQAAREKAHILKKATDPKTLAKAVNSRALRHELRLKCAQAIAKEGLDKHLVQALRDHDLVHMQVIEKAMKLVGVDFDHSEEAAELLSKQTATAAMAIASVAIAFKPATGPKDAIKTEYQEIEVVDDSQAGFDH